MRTAAGKSLPKGDVRKPLFLIKTLGRLSISLLSAGLRGGSCQRQKLGAILIAGLAAKI